jgi:flagellar biosynthesis protein FlhF
MRLKLYRASSVAEAMAQVRTELGAEALILTTRRVAGGVEVTAALEPESTPPVPLDPTRAVALAWHGVPTSLAQRMAAGPLAFALSAALRFERLPLASGSKPLLLAGPPGAGKTLTTARLATRLSMSGVNPVVITADGQRAGATEQLAAFTRLLRITLLVASNPVTLARALARRQEAEPVLIDAAGADVFDRSQAEELAAIAAVTGAKLALVLPAGLDPAEAAEVAAAYRELGASVLIATRLDIARRLGGIVAAAGVGLALTEAGTGPGVADGLTPLTPDLLARRLAEAAMVI